MSELNYIKENGTPDNPLEFSSTRFSEYRPRVTLNDGTEITKSTLDGTSVKNTLWVILPKESAYDISSAVITFGNPEKTSHIEKWVFDDQEPEVYDGYIQLIGVSMKPDGSISIHLEKPTS